MTDIHGQTEKDSFSHHGQHLCQVWLNYTEQNLISIFFKILFPLLSIITLTSEINRVHPLIIGNMYAKFYQNTLNTLISIVFTRLFHVTYTFDLWPPISIAFILTSWAITTPNLVNIHSMILSLFCSQGYIHFRVLWPWTVPLLCIVTLTCYLQIYRVHPIIIIDTSAKFDEDWYNSLVPIAFTISKHDKRNHSSISIIPPPCTTCCAGIINQMHYQRLTTWSSCILRTSGRRMRLKNSPRFL